MTAGPRADEPLPPSAPAFASAQYVQVMRFVLVVLSAFVYLGIPALGDDPARPNRFPQLARAMLDGRLTLVDPQPSANELIPAEAPNAFYVPYPPLPAILLMPFVLVAGSVKVEIACRVVSVLNVALFDACLSGLPRLLSIPPLALSARTALNLLFAFGTVAWHNADMGGDWHLAHAVALAAMLLALREYVTRRRPLVVGAFIAATIATRPTAGLTCLFFFLGFAADSSRMQQFARLAAGPILSVLALGFYNAVRFGNPLDFGYDCMVLGGEGRALLDRYGQFHPHFIPINGFWYFVAPPAPAPSGMGLGYDPHGLGLFIATPAFLYVVAALRHARRSAPVRHAAIAALVCVAVLLLHFNTGFWQFGHRFSMDYLPMLMILTLAGMAPRFSPIAWTAIGASILINLWGVLVAQPELMPESWTPG